jgi:ribosomal protein S18 acetylase RimI-like enzyme
MRGTVTIAFELRHASDGDREWLYALHCATMRDVVERTWGWDEAWQRAHFDSRFAPAAISVITVAGRDVGVLSLQARPAELYVAALEVAPEMQGRGLGTAVMRRVLADAASRGLPVTLQVLKANEGARRLYERLGFQVTGEVERHLRMRHAGPGP